MLLLHLIILSDTDTPTVRFPWRRDQPGAETCTWQNTILTADKRPCPPAEFEPAIPAGKRPQTHTLEHAAMGSTGFWTSGPKVSYLLWYRNTMHCRCGGCNYTGEHLIYSQKLRIEGVTYRWEVKINNLNHNGNIYHLPYDRGTPFWRTVQFICFVWFWE